MFSGQKQGHKTAEFLSMERVTTTDLSSAFLTYGGIAPGEAIRVRRVYGKDNRRLTLFDLSARRGLQRWGRFINYDILKSDPQ